MKFDDFLNNTLGDAWPEISRPVHALIGLIAGIAIVNLIFDAPFSGARRALMLLSSGPLGFGPGLGSLFLWIVTWGLLIMVLAVMVYETLGKLTLGQRAVGYVFAIALSVFSWVPSGNEIPTPAAREPQSEIIGERPQAVARWVVANLAVRARWRADLDAAGASGQENDKPSWLDVEDSGETLLVVNKASQALNLRIARFARLSANPGDVRRCWYDMGEVREIAAGQFHRFGQFGPDRGACAQAPLEFRIGDVLDPEPSWWSASALEEFDAQTAELRDWHERHPGQEIWSSELLGIGQLEEHAMLFEESLRESGRASRWRAALTAGNSNDGS